MFPFRKKTLYEVKESVEPTIQERIADCRKNGFGAIPKNVVDEESLYLDLLSICSELLETRFPNGGYGKEQIQEVGLFILSGMTQYQSNEFNWDDALKYNFPCRNNETLSHIIGWCYYIESNKLDSFDVSHQFLEKLEAEDIPSVQDKNVRPEIEAFLDYISYRDMSYKAFQDLYDEFLTKRQDRENEEITKYVDYIQSLTPNERLANELGITREIDLTGIIARSSYDEFTKIMEVSPFGMRSATSFAIQKIYFCSQFPEEMKKFNEDLNFRKLCNSYAQQLCGNFIVPEKHSYDNMALTPMEEKLFEATGMFYDDYEKYYEKYKETTGGRPEFWTMFYERKDRHFDLFSEWARSYTIDQLKKNKKEYEKTHKRGR